jgi:hypothetical protein
MWYHVPLRGKTVTLHADDCGQRPRVSTYPCGCTDVSRDVPHRTWCAVHVSAAAITRLLGTKDWEEARCPLCQPLGGAVRARHTAG